MGRLNTSTKNTRDANKSRTKLRNKRGANNKTPQNINFKHSLEQNNYSPKEIDPVLIYATLKVLKFIIIGSSIILIMVILGKTLC